MLAPFKLILITFGIVIMFLFATGILNIKQDGYACAGGWDVSFRDKVEVFHYGPVHIHAVPFTRECSPERRYDPDNIDACVATGFCATDEAAASSSI